MIYYRKLISCRNEHCGIRKGRFYSQLQQVIYNSDTIYNMLYSQPCARCHGGEAFLIRKYLSNNTRANISNAEINRVAGNARVEFIASQIERLEGSLDEVGLKLDLENHVTFMRLLIVDCELPRMFS